MDYPIVAMIGSSRFKKEYHDEEKRLTLEGNLVIPLCLYRDTDYIGACKPGKLELLKEICDQKVRLCDYVFVVNPNGYIGHKTAESIAYAKSLSKKVVYMEDVL